MAKSNKSATVVKQNVLQKRKVYDLKPPRMEPPKRAGPPIKDYFGEVTELLPIPRAIHIGGLSDCFFALFAHIGQKDGCTTVYRRLTKFEITIKGPSWSLNTARTFLLMAEYFQKVWWFRSTELEFKLKHLQKVELRTILLSAPEIFKNRVHANIFARHMRDVQIIAKTKMTLRDLETGEIYKKFADVPILSTWNADTLIIGDVERRYVNYPPDVERQYVNSDEKWNADTLIIEQESDNIDESAALGKNNREEFIYNSIGKPYPQVEKLAINYTGGALMRLQTMTGGRGRYKLQAFDCELPKDHRKMAEYLSCAFFSAWRNTGKEIVPSRSFSFETYAAIIGMSSYLKNFNRDKIVKVLNRTAPYFCKSWSVEGSVLNFVMSRFSNREVDPYG